MNLSDDYRHDAERFGAVYRARRDAAHERERQRRARNRRAMWACLGWAALAAFGLATYILAAAIWS
jgi:hypothetical protein